PTPAPSSGYEVYLATSSVAPGVNTTPTYTSTSTSVSIPSGLSPATSYYCWIRSNCGGAKSAWSLVTNFVTNQLTGCNTAYYGQWPTSTYTPSCSGSIEQININAWAGEYNNVNILANRQYTFSTSVATDFITITNDSNVVLASGPSPLSWASQNYSGVIRYYLHADSNCGIQNIDRTRYIQCATLASCGLPSALAVSNITSNSCRLTWSAPTTGANSYDIYVSTNNTAPVAATNATQTSNGNIVGALNNLASSTTYYYWVRSNCNGTKSAWVSGGSFTTIAALICNGAIYGLYPETTFTPTCSASSEQIVPNAWAGEYSNVNVNSNHQYTFSSSVATDFITITNASGTSVLASGTSPLVWNSTTSGVIRYHLNTNVNCGFQNSIRVKSIQCTATSSCGMPSNLVVSNITSNSCRLFWNSPTPPANSYDIYMSTSSTTPLAITNATQTSTPNLVGYLNGLSASTTYFYWVRSNCNGTKSAWVSGGSFTTIATLNCNDAFYGLYPNDTFTPSCTGNFEQISNNAWAGEYSNVSVLANKQYTFTSSIATDYITITNANGTSVLASGVTPLIWNSASATGVVRYHINSDSSCGIQSTSRIRSVKCATASSCAPPTNFGNEVLSSTSAVIGWIPSTSAPNGGYFYAYNTTPIIGTGGIYGSTFSTNAELNNLTPNTTYYWWVSSNCTTSDSDWAYGGSFTTPAASGCNVPTQLYYDGLGSTSNNIAWVAPTPAPSNGYIYCYSTVNDPFSGGAIIGTTTETFAVLSTLSPNTTYYFWVKSNCGNIQSNWVSGGSFTTPAVATTGCWQSVSAGMSHTMAIRSDGTLWAWGANDFGQLGDGTSIAKTTPIQIGTANDWQSVSAGTLHTMAIKNNGTLWGWGINGNSRLGDGTTTGKLFPTQIGSATNWKSVCAGDVNTLAIKTNGTLWAWGYNGYAQFGDGTMNNKTTPYQVGTATNWQSVDLGNLHTVATKTNGTLWAWGTNTYGQVGDGTTAVRFNPVQIGTETDWKSIAAGANHSVALKTNGVLYTWGHNQWGQLGDNTNVSKSSPSPVFDQVQNITAGSDYTAGTTTFGNMWSCGNNFFGQLGNGTTTNSNSIQVTNSNNHQMVAAGTEHTLSLHTDGSLSACGANGSGKLGNGSTVNSSTLVSIACSPSLDVEEFATTGMKFYPNPVNDMLNISFEREITKISIYNLLGQEVFAKTSSSNQITVDMSNLASGAYLVKVNAGDVVKTEKIIKN
ncbi:MAG: T9SS type A sorting domain-containing protein, partial [Flavobacterium sp.]